MVLGWLAFCWLGGRLCVDALPGELRVPSPGWWGSAVARRFCLWFSFADVLLSELRWQIDKRATLIERHDGRSRCTKGGDLNGSDFIPDLSRFSHYKKWKECDKKVINSLPITGVHNKLKNSIVFFLFINSFLTSLSFLHYRNILGFSSLILVSFSPPADMHALGWTEVECHPARYVMELDVVILLMDWMHLHYN